MTLCNIFTVFLYSGSTYNDSMDEPFTRRLARFIRELVRIRKKYADLLFYKHFNDTISATIQGANIRYSVFKPFQPNDKSRASAVNFGNTPESAEIDIDVVRGEITITTPFRQAVLPVQISLHPHHFARIVQP